MQDGIPFLREGFHGEQLHQLLSGSEIHYVRTEAEQAQLARRDPADIVRETGTRLGNIFVGFLDRNFTIINI